MKKAVALLSMVVAALAACSPQIHIDLLGQEKLEEIVLVPSPAKEKILMIDIDGMISSALDTGLFFPGEERRLPRLRASRNGRPGPLDQGGHPQDRYARRRGDGERHHLS